MRATDLAKVAAQAEMLRIRQMLRRQAVRLALAGVGVMFLLGTLAFANVAGWQVARLYVEPLYATLIMLGINLLIAVIFALLAARSSPGSVERNALEIRQRSLREARSSLALGAVIPFAATLLRARRREPARQPLWRRLSQARTANPGGG
jgi:hypothetical protein